MSNRKNDSSELPQWLQGLQVASFVMLAMGVMFYFKGPAANQAQFLFRVGTVALGFIGLVTTVALGSRYGGGSKDGH